MYDHVTPMALHRDLIGTGPGGNSVPIGSACFPL